MVEQRERVMVEQRERVMVEQRERDSNGGTPIALEKALTHNYKKVVAKKSIKGATQQDVGKLIGIAHDLHSQKNVLTMPYMHNIRCRDTDFV
jgi:hypothetical protein